MFYLLTTVDKDWIFLEISRESHRVLSRQPLLAALRHQLDVLVGSTRGRLGEEIGQRVD